MSITCCTHRLAKGGERTFEIPASFAVGSPRAELNELAFAAQSVHFGRSEVYWGADAPSGMEIRMYAPLDGELSIRIVP